MKKFKLTKIKDVKIVIGKDEIILKDKEEIRQLLQGLSFIKDKVELEVDNLVKNDIRNY